MDEVIALCDEVILRFERVSPRSASPLIDIVIDDNALYSGSRLTPCCYECVATRSSMRNSVIVSLLRQPWGADEMGVSI